MEKHLVFHVRERLCPEIETGMTEHMTVNIASLMVLSVVVEVSLPNQAMQKRVNTKEQQWNQGKKSKDSVVSGEVASQPAGAEKMEPIKPSTHGGSKSGPNTAL